MGAQQEKEESAAMEEKWQMCLSLKKIERVEHSLARAGVCSASFVHVGHIIKY